MLDYIFRAILITSLAGTALTIGMLGFKRITERFFSSGWHYCMWIMIMVVMIIPVRIAVKTDIPETATTAINQKFEENSDLYENRIGYDAKPEIAEVAEAVTAEKNNNGWIEVALRESRNILPFLWAVVMGVLILIRFIRYGIFLMKIHRYSYVTECRDLKCFIDRKIIVRLSDRISSPLTVGLFRPTLLLPTTEMSQRQLGFVLAHEAVHIKRCDILYKWLLCFVKCVHWFNPAVYFIERQINLYCEMSCDMESVKGMTADDKKDYMSTILFLLTSGNIKPSPITTGMIGNKGILKKRFNMIKSKMKISKRVIVVSAITAVILVCMAVLAGGVINGRWLDLKLEGEMSVTANSEDFNILAMGVDERGRADTIMLLMFKENGIRGISIPRNSVISGRQISEILVGEQGEQALIDAVGKELSVPIEYYAKINFNAVKETVDYVGGIEYDVPADLKYDDPHQNLHINIKRGRQILNGNDVCNLLRYRKSNDGMGYELGDMNRIRVGQQIIKEFIRQKLLLQTGVSINEILNVVESNVSTNCPVEKLAMEIGRQKIENVQIETIPGKAETENGYLTYKIDYEETRKLLSDEKAQGTEGIGYVMPVYAAETENKSKNIVSNTNADKKEVITKKTHGEETKTKGEPKVHNIVSEPKEVHKEEIDYEFIELSQPTGIEEITMSLNSLGVKPQSGKGVVAGKEYTVKDYSFQEACESVVTGVSGEDGKMSLMFDINAQTIVNISFIDAETGRSEASFGVLADNKRIYQFSGLSRDKKYNIVIQGRTNSEWKIEGKYILY